MPATLFKHILAPIDFSGLSANALRYAFAIAQRTGARITAVYANSFTPPPYFTEGRMEEFNRQFRESFDEARRAASEFVTASLGAAAAGVETRVIEGLPADVIARAAAESGADLIVMGTHGRDGFNRWRLGSVAETALRQSRIPVLTVRDAGASEANPPTIRKILCPVNDSSAARESLRVATALAAAFGAKVTALHVREPGAHGGPPDLCTWIGQQPQAACDIEELTRQGDAAAEIVSASREPGCDLAVIGATHKPFADTTVLGVTTARVLRHAGCPVLMVLERAGAASEAAGSAC